MPVNVRIPDDLSAVLAEQARVENRSFSNLIVSVLRQHGQHTTFEASLSVAKAEIERLTTDRDYGLSRIGVLEGGIIAVRDELTQARRDIAAKSEVVRRLQASLTEAREAEPRRSTLTVGGGSRNKIEVRRARSGELDSALDSLLPDSLAPVLEPPPSPAGSLLKTKGKKP